MRVATVRILVLLSLVGSAPAALGQTTLYFPRLVTAAGATPASSEYTGFGVANLDTGAATLTFTAYERDGNLVAGPDIVNPATRTLNANRQLAAVDSQIFGTGLTARAPIAWVKVQSTMTRTVGFFLTFNGDTTVLDGADVSSATVTACVMPEIDAEGTTRLHVVNPGAVGTLLTLTLVDADGTTRLSVTRSIPASGALVESVADLFPGAFLDPSSYVRIVSTEGIVAYTHMEKRGVYVGGLNGQDASAVNPTLYAPQYVTGGGYRSTISIVNLDAVAGSAVLRLFTDDGTPVGNPRTVDLPARGKVYVSDPRYFTNPGTGMVQGFVSISSGVLRLAGGIVFGDDTRTAFAAALPLVSAQARAFAFSQVASGGTYFTGLALLNPGGEEATAVVEVADSTGARVAGGVEVIGAGQRRSRLLTEYFPDLASQTQGSGYIRVSASRPLAAFALFGTTGLTALAAVPPQPLDAATAAAPRIGSISPSLNVPRNSATTVTIDGVNLLGVRSLQFTPAGGITVTSIQGTATRIVAVLAVSPTASLGTRTVSVVVANGTSNGLPLVLVPFGSPPQISNFTIHQPLLSMDQVTLAGSFDFTDPDGDVLYTGATAGSAQLQFIRTGGCTVTATGDFLNKAGTTSGRVEFNYTYKAGTLATGNLTLQFRLVDAAGNASNTALFLAGNWWCVLP